MQLPRLQTYIHTQIKYPKYQIIVLINRGCDVKVPRGPWWGAPAPSQR